MSVQVADILVLYLQSLNDNSNEYGKLITGMNLEMTFNISSVGRTNSSFQFFMPASDVCIHNTCMNAYRYVYMFVVC